MIRWDPIVEAKILEHRGRLYSTTHHRVCVGLRNVAYCDDYSLCHNAGQASLFQHRRTFSGSSTLTSGRWDGWSIPSSVLRYGCCRSIGHAFPGRKGVIRGAWSRRASPCSTAGSCCGSWANRGISSAARRHPRCAASRVGRRAAARHCDLRRHRVAARSPAHDVAPELASRGLALMW